MRRVHKDPNERLKIYEKEEDFLVMDEDESKTCANDLKNRVLITNANNYN
jgi:hypothetical protein